MAETGKKVLASYQSQYVLRICKMALAITQKAKATPEEEAAGVIETKILKDNARASLYATWDASQRNAYGTASDAEKRRILVSNFLIDEKCYCEVLTILVKIFLLRLQVMSQVGFGILDQSQILDLYSNIDDLRDVTEDNWAQLAQNIDRYESLFNAPAAAVEDAVQGLAASLQSLASNLSVYSLFVSNFERAQKLLDVVKESNEAFRQFVTVQEICEGAELPILLAIPCIRFMQYLYIVEEIMSTYGNDRAKAGELNKARKALEQGVEEVNDLRNNIDLRMRVAYTQEKLFKGEVFLATPSRYFIKSGPLKKIYNKMGFKLKNHQKYMFFLFNDCLLYALRPSATSDSYKFKHAVPTFGMTVSDAPDTDKVSHAFYIESLGSQKSFTVYAAEQREKEEWMIAISKAAQRATNSTTLGAKGGDEIENVIEQGRKALARYAIRAADKWIQVSTDMGVNYFYQLKSGTTSLSLDSEVQISAQPPSLEAISDDHMGTLKGAKYCISPDCGRKAVSTLGDGRYCAIHAKDVGEFEDEKEESESRTSEGIPGVPDEFSPQGAFGKKPPPLGLANASAFGSARNVGRAAPEELGRMPKVGNPSIQAPPAPPAPAPPPAPPAPGVPAPPRAPTLAAARPAPQPPTVSQAAALPVGFGLPRARAPPAGVSDVMVPRIPMRPLVPAVAAPSFDEDPRPPSESAPPPPPPDDEFGSPQPIRKPSNLLAFRAPGPPEQFDQASQPPVLRRVGPPTTGPVPVRAAVPSAPVMPAAGPTPPRMAAPPSIPSMPTSTPMPPRVGAAPSMPTVPMTTPAPPRLAAAPAAPLILRAPAPPTEEEEETDNRPVLPTRGFSNRPAVALKPISSQSSSPPPAVSALKPVKTMPQDEEEDRPVISSRTKVSLTAVRSPTAPRVAAPPPLVVPPPPTSDPDPPEPKWQKVMSEQYKQYYFWCEATNEVTWIKPPDYDGPE